MKELFCIFLCLLHKETLEPKTMELLIDYPHIYPCEFIDDVRFESIPDIIAMKLLSITDNGSRIKDFIDIAFLSSRYSLNEMLSFYMNKIPNSNSIMTLKALTYFHDINFNEAILLTNTGIEWNDIARRLIQMTKNPDRIFNEF